MCVADVGDPTLSFSSSVSASLLPVSESDGGSATVTHCHPFSSTSSIRGIRPLYLVMSVCLSDHLGLGPILQVVEACDRTVGACCVVAHAQHVTRYLYS